jgi:hypothetical protein
LQANKTNLLLTTRVALSCSFIPKASFFMFTRKDYPSLEQQWIICSKVNNQTKMPNKSYKD